VKISGTTISYDNSTYLTTSAASATYLALAGGTLTGALSGTSATFSGTLGIGTAISPAAELQVGKASDVTIAMSNSSSVTSGNRGSIAWYNSSVSTVANIKAVAVTDNVGTELQFYTRPAAGSLTQNMTITSGGNVGIGTAPDLKLTVNGAMNLRNSTRAGAFEIDSSGNLWMGTATTAGNLYFETGHSTTGLPSTGTARMTITGGGNVGIGIVPNTWAGTNTKALQVYLASVSASLTYGTALTYNTYYDGSWKYTGSFNAGKYEIGGDEHLWYSAPSGTAGNVATFTERMKLNNVGNLTVNSYANMTGGTFNVPASTTKTVTVTFNGGNIHAFLGFSSQSGGITGAGSKSIFLGGTTNDGAGHTPTVISTFSYGDQIVGTGTTNTSAGFTFTIQNNKGSAVSWSWSAFGSFSTLTVS